LKDFLETKAASRLIARLSDEERNAILIDLAEATETHTAELLAANALDLGRMDQADPRYDRLQLTEARLKDIAADLRKVASLPSPLGRVLKHSILPNGLELNRVSVPFGVIGIIYEARPNVTFDVFSLCLKSGNACVLKGGKDADSTNRTAIRLIHDILSDYGIDTAVAELLPATHEATAEMLNAVGYIDVCIPRGGKKLINFVRDNAKVPVIETGAGVVNLYFDEYGDTGIGAPVINNAKTRRVSVCNALDCLIIHKKRLQDLPGLCAMLKDSHVKIYADDDAYGALCGNYPDELLRHATAESYGTEFMDYVMAVRTVSTLEEAIEHIRKYGSGHSESIITENQANADTFQSAVDAACVYVNAPTSFTDGAQFGLGAEIGISTQKLGPRGPMALEEMTTYKWLIKGHGQIRR
jgi:glutamate-5-semialdehyde dehydrogenase